MCYPLNSEYLSGLDLLVISTSNLSLTFWDVSCYRVGSGQPRIISRIRTSKSQTLLTWCEGAQIGNKNWENVLYTAGTEPYVNVWKVDWFATKFKAQQTGKLVRHTDIITDMAISMDQGLLMTSSMDKMIHVWDVATQRWYASRKGHNKGIKTLAYAGEGTCVAPFCSPLHHPTLIPKFRPLPSGFSAGASITTLLLGTLLLRRT